MSDRKFEAAMAVIVAALKERGYNPYDQLYGYVKERQPIYITGNNNARNLIQTLDFDMVKQYVEEMKKAN